MGSAGDEGIVDPQQRPDPGGSDARGSFDPGLETGDLRRAPRDHELSPELGGDPFDPGPGHYDERRALREAQRREREARRRREARQTAGPDRPQARPIAGGRTSQAAALQPVPEPESIPAAPVPGPEHEPAPLTVLRPRRESPAAARIEPAGEGPVRRGGRGPPRRRGLVWPTAKAGLAVTVALALG